MNTEKICQKLKIGNGKKTKKMELIYKNNKIMATETTNKTILKYHFQKLYYAIIIKNCNRYSSIANKQRVDIVLTDDNLNILSFKKEMHENTFYENKDATTTILLPLNYFDNLEKNTKFIITKKNNKRTIK